MELHTLFQRFIKIAALRKLKINMGDYGAPTLKPTILYSSPLSLREMKRGPLKSTPNGVESPESKLEKNTPKSPIHRVNAGLTNISARKVTGLLICCPTTRFAASW